MPEVTAPAKSEQALRSCPLCQELRAEEIAAGADGVRFLRCRHCGLGYWSDRWDDNRMGEHYHEYYSPESMEYNPLTGKRYGAILERMERMGPPGRLLDVGCGAGHFLSVAQRRGWEGTGLEISESALRAAEEMKRKGGLRFHVLRGTLEKAGFPAGQFRAVTLFEVLEHLDDPLDLLRQAHRNLEENGILFLTTPNLSSLSRRVLGMRWRVIAPEHRCLFTPPALRALLLGSGFQPLTLTTKNVDLPEIYAKWTRSPSVRHPSQKDSASQQLRHRVEENSLLRNLKGAVNRLLNLTGSGDTIEALAIKREGGSRG